MRLKSTYIAVLAAALVIFAAAGTDVFGQGRGRGGGGGRPASAGPPMISPGIGRGNTDTAPIRSEGRKGRSDNGTATARSAPNGSRMPSDNELNRYRGLSRKLGTTPQAMRARYLSALKLDPDLTFGQFAAANVVADNLHSRYPNVTASNILAGMANGQSLGQTLKDLRVPKPVASDAEKTAKQRIKIATSD